MNQKCPREFCKGNLEWQKDEFDDPIRRCILCGRSPEEKPITYEEVVAVMTGKGTDIEPRKRRKKTKS